MEIAKDGPPPSEDQLSMLAVIGQSGTRRVETPRLDAPEPWADQIYQWLTGDRLQMTRIHELLAAGGAHSPTRRCGASWSSATGAGPADHRPHEGHPAWPGGRGRLRAAGPDHRCRNGTAPGEQAQFDWGSPSYLGGDERSHSVWAFVMPMGWSRACYLELVRRADTARVIQCHVNAYEYLGSLP